MCKKVRIGKYDKQKCNDFLNYSSANLSSVSIWKFKIDLFYMIGSINSGIGLDLELLLVTQV